MRAAMAVGALGAHPTPIRPSAKRDCLSGLVHTQRRPCAAKEHEDEDRERRRSLARSSHRREACRVRRDA